MPRDTIVTDLWNWDIHFENYTFADNYFDVALGPEKYALACAEELKEDFLRWIDEYDMDYAHDLWHGQEEFETYVLKQCENFIRKWRSNIKKKFLGDDEDDYRQTVARLTRFIEQGPKYVENYEARAAAYEHVGEYRLAISDYDMVISLEPTATSFYRRGCVYEKLGEYGKAIADLTKAIERAPRYLRAYSVRGDIHRLRNQYDQAIRDYGTVITLQPKDFLAYFGRGVAHGDSGNIHQAIADYSESVALVPKFAPGYYNRALAYTRIGRYEQALSDFNKAIELGMTEAKVYFWRGTLYGRDLKNYTESLKDYNRVIEIDPKYAAAYYNRGTVHEQLGNRDQAIADTKTAAKLGLKAAQEFLKNKGIGW